MTKKKASTSNEIKNWYEILPKSMTPQYHNPCFDKHKMTWPFRSIIVGGSGSGKTTLVLEMIHRMNDTFGLIILCVKNASEPLYDFLKSKLKPEQLHIYENGEVPPLEKYKDEEFQILTIFDDLVAEKNQKPMIDYYIRSRKIAKGVSCVYLSQSYFLIPKTIRINCNYIMLKKLSSTKDLKQILRDFSLGLEPDELMTLYKYATDDKKSFLMVDLQSEMEERFRKSFLEIIPVPV